jgi:hypothetical protein
MLRFVALAALGLVVQACAMAAPIDPEATFFASLFDGPSGGGSCRELRRELRGEIEGIKAAQKKADDEFIAEQSGEANPAPPPLPHRRRFGRPKTDPLASLRDVARRTKIAEDINQKLKTRGCRAVDIEQALKAPDQSKDKSK